MVAALRRLALLVLLASAVTTAGGLLLGALLHASLARSVSVAFYGLGCFLMVSGFFVGNRGPARMKSESDLAAAPSLLPMPGFGSRRLRWATLEEQNETINNSAVFVTLGLILVVIGVVVDSRQSLF
jgi:hypothetical protein